MNPASVTHPFPEDVGRRPRPAPLLPAALGMVCGIAADNAFQFPIAVYLACCVPAVAALFTRRHRFVYVRLSSFLGALALGAILHDASYRRISPDHIVRYVGDDPVTARLRGTVVSTPRVASRRDMFFSPWMYSPRDTRFLVAVSSIDGRAGPIEVSGAVAVKVDGAITGIRLGDTVELFGRLYRPRGPSNPGQFDFARWQRRRGVLVSMVCPHTDLVTFTARRGWRHFLAELRVRARAAFTDNELATRGQETALLETMVLGSRHAVDKKTERLFIQTGTAHFLAVSGAHVGVIAGFVWFFARFFGATRRRCAAFVIAVLVFYVCIVEPRPPIFRATIIGVLYCIGMLLRRTPCAANSISLAMIILLAIRPPALFDAGFQLSFAAVFAISYLYHPLLTLWYALVSRWKTPVDTTASGPKRRSIVRQTLHYCYHAVCNMAAVGTAACLVTMPLVGIHFGRIAPLAVLFGVFLIPFFTLSVFFGFLTVTVSMIGPAMLSPVKTVAQFWAGLLLDTVGLFAGISPEFTGLWAIVGATVYACIIGFLIGSIRVRTTTVGGLVRQRIAKRRGAGTFRRLAWIAGPLFVVTMLGCIALIPGLLEDESPLRVTHLSVGGGTAAVIEFPNGKVWLYDCGTNRNYDVGTSTIVPFCRSRGIGRIDRVLFSHPNLDHFSGVFAVMDAIPTGPITVNASFIPLTQPRGPADALLKELRRRNHPFVVRPSSGDVLRIGEVTVETLRPSDFVPESANDASMVLRLTYRGRSILMCGDIEEAAMAALIERGGLHADVLVLPHHGSVEKNTADFIAAVAPAICIRSASRRMADASIALREAIGGREVFDTADDGAVTLTIGETGLTVHGFLPPDAARSVTIPLGE